MLKNNNLHKPSSCLSIIQRLILFDYNIMLQIRYKIIEYVVIIKKNILKVYYWIVLNVYSDFDDRAKM